MLFYEVEACGLVQGKHMIGSHVVMEKMSFIHYITLFILKNDLIRIDLPLYTLIHKTMDNNIVLVANQDAPPYLYKIITSDEVQARNNYNIYKFFFVSELINNNFLIPPTMPPKLLPTKQQPNQPSTHISFIKKLIKRMMLGLMAFNHHIISSTHKIYLIL